MVYHTARKTLLVVVPFRNVLLDLPRQTQIPAQYECKCMCWRGCIGLNVLQSSQVRGWCCFWGFGVVSVPSANARTFLKVPRDSPARKELLDYIGATHSARASVSVPVRMTS